jgi:septal ring factor EnvC (AmiA/AmiB activator)
MNFPLNYRHIFFFIFFCVSSLSAQNYNQLVKQKEKLIQESKALTSNLKETQSTQKHTLEALKIVNKQISVKEGILSLLDQEINVLKSQEKQIEKELEVVVVQLELLKKNYSTLIQKTHHLSLTYNRLLFFFSSKDFNQLLRRFHHLRKMEEDRRKKYKSIQEAKIDIENKKQLLVIKKLEQGKLQKNKKTEIRLLWQTKQSKESTVDVLKNKEDSLLQALSSKELQKKKITNEILSILSKEKSKEDGLTPELKLISSNFVSNKGRLPWPTTKGTVITKFGESPHPVLSGITIMNNGIEIATTTNDVRSVFDGEVSKIMILPNGYKVLILRHGEYFSVYSNLYDVNVQKGQKIKTKQTLGSIYNPNSKKRNVLGFQIWKSREKLNPKNWLSSY